MKVLDLSPKIVHLRLHAIRIYWMMKLHLKPSMAVHWAQRIEDDVLEALERCALTEPEVYRSLDHIRAMSHVRNLGGDTRWLFQAIAQLPK